MMRKLIVYAVALSLSGSLCAQTVQDMQGQSKQLQQEISALQKRISVTSNDIKGQVDKYRMGQQLLANRRKLITGIDGEITTYSQQIAQKTADIKRLDQQCDRLLVQYKTLLMQAYRNRDTKVWFMYVLGSQDLQQAFRRWRYFKTYGEAMRRQVRQINETQAQLETARQALQQWQEERVAARLQRQTEVDALQKEQKGLNGDIQKLRKNEKQLKAELQRRQSEQKKLNDQIAAAIAAAAKKDKNATPAVAAAAKELAGDFAKNKGALPWPVDNAVIVEPFGRIVDRQWGFTFDNKGVTLSSSKGATVKSIFNGTVTSVWTDSRDSYLIRVLVSHGNYHTIYCHIADVAVKEGDTVKTGQKLGTLAAGGDGTCFFQLLFNSTPQNPAAWCGAR